MKRLVKVFRGLSAATLLLAICSCSSAPPPANPTPAAPVLPTQTAGPQHLSPLREGTWTYKIVEGDGKGNSIAQILTSVPSDTNAPWRRAFSVDHVIAHLRQESDGSIVMIGNEILDHGVDNAFDPPQVVLPAPGAFTVPLNVTSKVTTTLRNSSKTQIDHGTATLSLAPGGFESVATPAGTFSCQRIDLTLQVSFGFGEVESSARLYYADGVGLVAESYREKASAFFMTTTITRKSVLTAYPH